jgi:hypothetical protein
MWATGPNENTKITELLLIPGIDFVGPLPRELQANIVYATATLPVIKKLGLEPA